MQKVSLQFIRDLKISRAQGLHEIKAASGLVKIENTLYIIADDDLSLGILSLEPKGYESLIPLISGELPQNPAERKKIKPDWEAIVKVASPLPEQEGLLVIPSGSKANRQMGVFVKLNDLQDSENMKEPQYVDFTKIYEKLRKIFVDLNFEAFF